MIPARQALFGWWRIAAPCQLHDHATDIRIPPSESSSDDTTSKTPGAPG